MIGLLSDIGQQQRWRGPFGAALAGVAGLALLVMFAYWRGGKRRLTAAPAARGRQGADSGS